MNVLNAPGIAECTPAARRRAAMSRASRVKVVVLCSLLITGLWSLSGFSAERKAGPGAESAGKAVAVQVVARGLDSLPGVATPGAGRTVSVASPRSSDEAGNSLVEPTDFSDPLVRTQQVASAKAASGVTLDLNFPGIAFTGAIPANVVGEAGGDRFVQMVNAPGGSVFAVYDLADGDLLAGPGALDALWQGAGACAEGWGHPNVVHDALADRWVLSELGAGNHLCVYVSQTADPVSGGWYAYDFELPWFPDFPRIGVWSDGYSVATNEDQPAVYALQRSAMLDGAAASWQRFAVEALDGFGFQALAPADLDGPDLPAIGTGGLFARHVDGQAHGGSDRIELFELDVNWGDPGSSSLSGPAALATAPFDSSLCGYSARGCVPQPGSDVRLDPVREVITWALRYRKSADFESLVGNFTVDTDGSNSAGIRWFELRRNGGSWSLHQEGTFSPDDSHRWIGSAAKDGDGNLALVFNVADGSATYPSIRVAGRESDDSTGLMTAAETEIQAGTSAQTEGPSPEQWSTSTSLSVATGDDCTFWTTAAYAEEGAWNTRIASFRFPSCNTVSSDMIFADGVETGNLNMWSSVSQ